MANAKETRSVKNNIGLALFILILVAMFFIPTSETLTAAGRNSLGLLLATIVCMLTGGLPIGVLCMLVIPLMYICGSVKTPAAALAVMKTFPTKHIDKTSSKLIIKATHF